MRLHTANQLEAYSLAQSAYKDQVKLVKVFVARIRSQHNRKKFSLIKKNQGLFTILQEKKYESLAPG